MKCNLKRFTAPASLLMCSNVWAASYPYLSDTFPLFTVYGFGASALAYVVLAAVLLLFDKLKVWFMIPGILVLLAAGFLTLSEIYLTQVTGGLPGGLLSGALLSTGLFIYMVKRLLVQL